MKTFILKDEQGVCTGFEIYNNFISSGAIGRYIKRISSCRVNSIRKLFEKTEIHVTFMFKEIEFFVWETFGDSSHLIIGSESDVNEKIIK